ncbi:ROK family transcriptional regulator [Fodinicola feengrottensis]|uniref:ROK family transcriptional regulator n=1 Tax=Fodinicola feengrottensis TaxID=435914 RepID=A0ABN2J3Z8_9ACTN
MPSADRPLTRLTGNQARIAQTLRVLGPSTRAELINATGLSRATVSAVVGELTASGLVIEPGGTAPAGPSGGRPAAVVQLDRSAGLVVGVDVGRSHLRIAVADLAHTIVAEAAERTVPGEESDAAAVLERAAAAIERLLLSCGHTLGDVIGVGFGLPAPVVNPAGQIGSPNIFPGWAGLTPTHELGARLGVPVCVENDANLGALSESLWGAGRGHQAVVYVKLGTGIGAGIVFDGQLFRGVTGTAGEIGHLSLDTNGDICRCGNRGCLELVASGAALVTALHPTRPDVTDLTDLVRLAIDDDAACRRLLADAGGHVGVALGGIVNLINPDRVLIGGELGRAGALLLDPLTASLQRSAVPAAVAALSVGPGILGERAEVLGALALVLREPERLVSPETPDIQAAG